MDPLVVFSACGSVIGALLVFSCLVLFGVWIVRVLALPQDLPLPLRFEPAPPPVRPRGDRAEAAVTAARQSRLRAVQAQALMATQFAHACQDLLTQAESLAPGAVSAEPLATLRTAESVARVAAENAERGRAGDLEAGEADAPGWVASAREAYERAATAAASLPQESSRRKWLLLAIAVLAIAWLAAIILYGHLHAPGAGSSAY